MTAQRHERTLRSSAHNRLGRAIGSYPGGAHLWSSTSLWSSRQTMTRAAKTAIDISTSVPICSPSRISLHSELFLVAGDRVSCVRCCHQDLRKLPCVLRREVEPLSLGLVPLVAAPTEFDSLECHDHL